MSSFLPAPKNFPFWKESTFRYAFEWKDETIIEGLPVLKPHDLTGYTGSAILKPVAGEPGVALELTTANGGIIFGGYKLKEPKNGLVEIYISREQLEAIEWKKAKYTLYAVEPEPPHDDYALLSGRFTQAGPPL